MKQPGFHFIKSTNKENEFHEDCACSLAFLLGQTEQQYWNYEHQVSFWYMLTNPKLIENEEETGQHFRKIKFEDSIDEINYERRYNSVSEDIREDLRISLDLSEEEKSEPDIQELRDNHFIE